MIGGSELDPERCEYGAATPAVRRILREWLAIDWFAPPAGAATETRAVALFNEHNARARVYGPDLFPAAIEIVPVRGGWAEFADLCARVRIPGAWDWKYGALKRLSSEHSQRHGLDLRAYPSCADITSGVQPGPGALFFRYDDAVIWNDLGPRLALDPGLAGEHAEAARWYLGYAQMELMAAIEWQLAEASDALDGDPFVPLLGCYGAGFYPFSLGVNSLVLFAFRPSDGGP